MPDHLLFWIALGFLLTHEMDAVRCREWKLFFFLSWLPDEQAYRAFTALHVPLFALLLAALVGAGAPNLSLVFALDIFCVVHVGLHLLFLRHPDYEFRSWFSWALIAGAGVAGGVDLLVRL
jgi:hypothetical protein